LRQNKIGQWETDAGYFRDDVVKAHDIYLLPTTCFQTPVHVACVDWYRKLVPSLSQPDFLERTELANVLHQTGAVNEMACYIPSGPMGRLYHLDGRNLTNRSQMLGVDRPPVVKKDRQHPSVVGLKLDQ
jgi:hypothetical protein